MTANRMLIYFRAHTPGVFVEAAEDQTQGLLNVWQVFFLLLNTPQPLSIKIMNYIVFMPVSLCLGAHRSKRELDPLELQLQTQAASQECWELGYPEEQEVLLTVEPPL